MKTGIFVGSFRSVHHRTRLIVRGTLRQDCHRGDINGRKRYMLSNEERTERIARLYAGNPKVEVKAT